MEDEYHSQYNQDKILEKYIFKGYKGGFFVDVGAHDGVSINNTLYFEKKNKWTGINIEPLKEVYNKLVINRPDCININCAVCDFDGRTEFISNSGYTEMLSGIKSSFDERHHQRVFLENKHYGEETNIINVNTKRLETIFDQHNISHINYLSIDVEGGEFNVIKSINFDKVFIDVIEFESNYKDTTLPIISYLEEKNFKVFHINLDIFMINNDSSFKT